MQVVFSIMMFVLGACLGSFLCCQARRLHLRAKKRQKLGRRSICPYCKHQLKWYENLPLISWTIQGGKCRHCHHKIGSAEIISECATACALGGLATTFNLASLSTWSATIFIITIILALSLIFLAIYDGLYGELPTFMLIIAAVIAIVLVATKFISAYQAATFSLQLVWNLLTAIALLGGLYLVLYLISHGKWVGDGDWILGSIIAAALGTPWLALVALFVANFSATIVTLPTIKSHKSHKIYFGPFLVFAYVLTLILASYGIINL